MSNRHFFRNWLILIALVLIIFFGVKAYWNYLKSAASKYGEVMAFVVRKGEGVTSVADRLESQRLIRSSLAFKLEVKSLGKESSIQAGDFKISPTENLDEVISDFSKGSEDKWVTLLEGWRNEEMAQKLHDELGIDQSTFLKQAKQGNMFPDTYLFNPKASVGTIVSILQNTFDQKYTPELQAKIKSLGLTPSQGVILASLVEREGRSDKVRTNMASILLKRLKIGMALDADSTLQYALGYSDSEKTWWRSVITAKDKEIDSPFNTYTNPGLPPAPICNPSLSSLNAVANADPSTPYLYYYNDSQGNTYYDVTREAHDLNVANHP